MRAQFIALIGLFALPYCAVAGEPTWREIDGA